MINYLYKNPVLFFVSAITMIIAMTIHELAHCYATDFLGDPTPRSRGRLTLDPRAHIDPLGFFSLILTGFGWGKPAPYDPYNLKDPIKDGALIALAGPMSNLALAVLASIFLYLIPMGGLLVELLAVFINFNLLLMVFNLIPVHPLDGSKILTALLPAEAAQEYRSFMKRFGYMVLLFMIIDWGNGSPIAAIVSPIINLLNSLLIP